MEKLSFKKRLGTQINAIVILFLALSAVTLLITTVLMFKSYNDDILVERAKVGMQVLEDTVSQRTASVEEAFWVITQDTDFLKAAIDEDKSTIAATWQKDYGYEDGMFLVVLNSNNSPIYQSDSCPISSDLNQVLSGGNGIVKTSSGLVTLYHDYVETEKTHESDEGVVSEVYKFNVIVGFDIGSTTWLKKVNSNVSCDVTIFRDNIRLATTIIDPSTNKPVVGTPMGETIKSHVLGSRQNYADKATIIGKAYYVSYAPMYDSSNNVCGAYFAGSDATNANLEFSKVITIATIIAVLFTVVATLVLVVFVRKRVVSPIEQVSVIADEMSKGQLAHTNVAYKFNGDEIGIFANKLNSTRKDISGYIGDISNILTMMGDGDFTGEPSMKYIGDFGVISTAFMGIKSRLSDIVSNIDVSSDGVKSGSGEIANGAQLLAEGATRQAEAIEQINGTVESISKQVSDTATNASRASDLSTNCLSTVEEQNKQMLEMLEAMNEIRDKSNSISAIIKTIEDIAFQTNILALNASVEAARAGAAGKGFAVVADEVRNLATKSKDAANNTNRLISDTVKAVTNGVELTQKTADSMSDVISKTKEVTSIVGDIKDAAVAEADAVAQVSQGISDITIVISQNSATAEETAASCEELASQSGILKDQVSKLRV